MFPFVLEREDRDSHDPWIETRLLIENGWSIEVLRERSREI